MTDAELDALIAAVRTYHQIDEEGVMAGVSRQACEESAAAITYLRAELEYTRSALRRVQHFAKGDAIGAAVLRERAVETAVQRKGDGTANLDHPYDKGYLAACDEVAKAIRALPIPTHAELLAHAMQLPEIKALVDASRAVVALWGYQFMPGETRHPMMQSGITSLTAFLGQIGCMND